MKEVMKWFGALVALAIAALLLDDMPRAERMMICGLAGVFFALYQMEKAATARYEALIARLDRLWERGVHRP